MKKLITTLMLASVLVMTPMVISSATNAKSSENISSQNNEIEDNEHDENCTPTWSLTGAYVITFFLTGDGTPYAHEASFTQTGPNVTGSGGYPVGGPPQTAWNVTSGTVTGNTVALTVEYTFGADGTTMHMAGTIAPNGSISGTWDDNYGGARTGTWSTTSGTATSTCAQTPKHKAVGSIKMSGPSQKTVINVKDKGLTANDKGKVHYWNYEYNGGTLHYKTDILCANVNPVTKEAWYLYQIPAGHPGLSGFYIVAYVKDGGNPGTNGDLYGHSVAPDLATGITMCETGVAPTNMYPITSGNIKVK